MVENHKNRGKRGKRKAKSKCHDHFSNLWLQVKKEGKAKVPVRQVSPLGGDLGDSSGHLFSL